MFKVKDHSNWDSIINQYPFIKLLRDKLPKGANVFVKFHKNSLLVASISFIRQVWRRKKGGKSFRDILPAKTLITIRCDCASDSYSVLSENDIKGNSGGNYLFNVLYFLDKFRTEGPFAVLVFEKVTNTWILHIIKKFVISDLVVLSDNDTGETESFRHYHFNPNPGTEEPEEPEEECDCFDPNRTSDDIVRVGQQEQTGC